MTTGPLRHNTDGLRPVFLVERYLSPTAADSLPGSVTRAARLCAPSTGAGSASEVSYLLSAYLAGEDTCFCLFQAATADAVRALNDEADFAFDRITAAVLLYPARPGV